MKQNKKKSSVSSTPKLEDAILAATMDRAREVQANLPQQFPSFAKQMLKSHVEYVFWLALDSQFCDSYLPMGKSTVTLVDEDEEEHVIVYLPHGAGGFGLSGGWGRFAKYKHLRVGDVVIFQLVAIRKLKVHIIRTAVVTELNGDVLNPQVELMDTDDSEGSEDSHETEDEAENQKCQEDLDKYYLEQTLMIIANYDPATDKFNSGSDMDYASDVLEGVRVSRPEVNVRDFNKLEDSRVQVDFLPIDSRIPEHFKKKYQELCFSQNISLHEDLMKDLNSNLAAGVIIGTVNIADGIKEIKSVKSVSDLEKWDRTLKSFEALGMKVGFMRDRISKLLSVYRKPEAEIELKKSERGEAE